MGRRVTFLGARKRASSCDLQLEAEARGACRDMGAGKLRESNGVAEMSAALKNYDAPFPVDVV